jgi:poly-gamma-glutamate capsule biosynthesis protein CapA/YwtB (metallophosphatase superfamily)
VKRSHSLKVIVTGDFCPNNVTITRCRNKEYDKIYNDTLQVLKDKDLSITNLECPLVDVTDPIVKSGPNLLAPPICIEALKYGGFDVAALANNHIYDQGDIGIKSTLDLCKQNNIATVGAGMNYEEASRTLFIEKKGIVTAIINCAENEHSIATQSSGGANLLDDILMYYAITDAKAKADYILLVIHSGNEQYDLPNPRMTKRFRFYASLGVTAIFAHHSHVPTGYEVYKGVPVFYGLGNFVFDKVKPAYDGWYRGHICKLELGDGRVKKFDLIPYFQNTDHDGLKLMNGNDYSSYLQRIEDLCKIITNDNALEKNWLKFSTDENNRKWFLRVLLNFNLFERTLYKLNLFNKRLIKQNQLVKMLNILRCDSNRDTIITMIEKEINSGMKN